MKKIARRLAHYTLAILAMVSFAVAFYWALYWGALWDWGDITGTVAWSNIPFALIPLVVGIPLFWGACKLED